MPFLVSVRNTRISSDYAKDFVNAIEDDLQYVLNRGIRAWEPAWYLLYPRNGGIEVQPIS